LRRAACCLIFALVCIPTLFAEQVLPEARKAAETIRQLRAIGIPSTQAEKPMPPGQVPALLRQLNTELQGLIVSILNDQTRQSVPDEKEIFDQLRAAGWDDISSNKWNAYGEINQIKFDWQLGYSPDLLVVSTQLWLPCGSRDPDTALYVFAGRARQWKLILATDSDFEPSLSEQNEGMQYRISPADENGKWFLVIAHQPPTSCGPQEGVLRYKALRPTRNPNQPEVIVAQREILGGASEMSYRLDVQSDWFAITERKPRKLDAVPGVVILRYQVNGNQAQRIHPLAVMTENFLDQWVQLPWDEAKRWTKPHASLEGLHSKLNKLLPDSAEIQSVHRCSGDGGDGSIWVIKLWIDRHGNQMDRDETSYIEISLDNGIFCVDAAYGSPPKSCPGEFLPYQPYDEPLRYW